ncbi:MAG: sigma-70 family RNA polymerase sigma factor [Polyangiaceae bacterium]
MAHLQSGDRDSFTVLVGRVLGRRPARAHARKGIDEAYGRLTIRTTRVSEAVALGQCQGSARRRAVLPSFGYLGNWPMLRPVTTDDSPPRGQVVALPIGRKDDDLIRGLRAGAPWAKAMLFDRFAPMVERLVRRLMGDDRHTDRADVVHDVFVGAFSSAHALKDAAALVSWMQSVTVHTAYNTIRQRKARSWLRILPPEELPELPVRAADADAAEAHARTYRVLGRLGVDERIVFVLRFLEGMDLVEVASACGVSLATVKRRLARAEKRFVALASQDPILTTWLDEGDRWGR